jgi:hypothetical protein
VSGQQVLHPEVYFAGQAPAPVAPPPAPPGTKVVTSGRMGELGTRLVLEVCAEKSVVKDFAPRWAGDAYTIVSDGKRALSLLWTTVWSGGAAQNVGNLIKLEPPCWEDQAASFGASGWIVASPSRSAVDGNLVAVARGAIDLDGAVKRQLAAQVRIPEPAAPLGDVPPLPTPKPVRVEGGRFVSEQLGLQGEMPREFAQSAGSSNAELSIQRAGAGAATLSFIPEPLSGEALDTFFQVTAAQLAAAEGGHLSLIGRTQRKLAGATADERSWQLEGKQAQVRIDVAPYCDGKGALALTRIERTEDAHAALDRLAASLEKVGASPACADLE